MINSLIKLSTFMFSLPIIEYFREKEWLNIFKGETDPCDFNCWVTVTGGWSGIVTPEWGDSFVTYKVGKLFAVCCHCYFRHDYKVLVEIMSFQADCDLREKDIMSDIILVLYLLNLSTIKIFILIGFPKWSSIWTIYRKTAPDFVSLILHLIKALKVLKLGDGFDWTWKLYPTYWSSQVVRINSNYKQLTLSFESFGDFFQKIILWCHQALSWVSRAHNWVQWSPWPAVTMVNT